MAKQYKKIMNDEIGGYHKQINKMRNNDANAILKTRRKSRVF
jgi:hypothetical protein